jgi:hypothetical protein
MTTLDTQAPTITGEGRVTAVTYQRVSTKEQATTGGRDEGFSIPAQREANGTDARIGDPYSSTTEHRDAVRVWSHHYNSHLPHNTCGEKLRLHASTPPSTTSLNIAPSCA